MAVAIWVGTTTGTAQFVAEEAAAILRRRRTTTVHMMEEILGDPSSFLAPILLVVCSTFGIGDMPDGARRLFTSLSRLRPDLSTVRHSVITLGDSSYRSTFALGGIRWSHLLVELGSHAIHETLVLDAQAQDGPDIAAGKWIAEFEVQLERATSIRAS